jgi:membrane-associated phospholipid phosphatase
VDAASVFFQFITKFGDSGFLLPASVFLSFGLFATGSRRNAIVFAAAWAACISATALAKILFMAYGGAPTSAAIHSPSGHASLSTMFFLSLGFIATGEKNRVRSRVLAALCIGLVALIAGSRVSLGAHTAAETFVGVVIGLASFEAFRRYSRPCAPFSPQALLIGAGSLVLAYAVLGASIRVEEPLERAASWLALRFGC